MKHKRGEVRIGVRIAGAAGLALALAACKIVPDQPPPESVADAAKAATLDATPILDTGPGTTPRNAPPASLAPVPSPARGPLIRQNGSGTTVGRSTPTAPKVGPQGDVTLNYVDTDIREIIRIVLGDMLHVNYTIDSRLQGNVSIQTATPLKQEELLPTLESLVSQVGGVIVFENGVFRITPAGNTAIVPPVVQSSSVSDGSQIVPLRYASAKQLATMLTPYVGDGAQIIADPGRNVLVISGSASARQSVIDLVHVFDVDYLAGQSYALFPVTSGEPEKVATDLQHALGIDADGPLAGAIKVVPIVQANAIMVVAQAPAYLDRAGRLIQQLDRVADENGRNVHVYHLRNTQAVDLQPILQTAFNPPQAGGGANAGGPGSLPPTAIPAQVSAAPGAMPGGASAANGPQAATTTGLGSTGGGAGTGGAAPGQQSSASTIFSPTPGGPTGPNSFGGQVTTVAAAPGAPQIIADVKGNSLIVVSTETDYGKVEAAIRKLDVLPPQVLVEATIAEVTLNKALQYGTQFYFNNAEATVTLSGAQSAVPTIINPAAPLGNSQLFSVPTFAPAFPGLAVTRFVGSQQYAIQALESVTDVKVISAPKILILDQQQASIQVGSLVPIITQSAISVATAGAPVVNSGPYQPTGIILNVTPRIGTDGLVSLDIDQEVSNVINTTSSTIDSPSFTERRIKSQIAVEDGQTIGLAGLISDNKSTGNSGIPVLRSIPVLGALFSTQNNSDIRTELLVLITPRVVRDARDARGITEELKRKLGPPAHVAQ
jgi:general secretion pathway protein D